MKLDKLSAEIASGNGLVATTMAVVGPSGSRLHLASLDKIEMRRITWLEPPLIARGMLTGLVAPGGTVKGLYGIHLTAKLAEREERTLFLCSEAALAYIVKPRLVAAGSDGDHATALEIAAKEGTRNLRFPSDLPALADAISVVKPALVIIDPIASFLDRGLDMAKNEQMRSILQPLITLAQESNAAIIPVYHTGKARQGALGSVAFEDACRFVLTAAKDDEDEDVRHIELTKSAVGRTGEGRKLRIVEVPVEIEGETVGVAKLVDEGRSSKSVQQLLQASARPGPEPVQRESARETLKEILVAAEGQSLNSEDVKRRVKEQTGASPATVWRAFSALRKEGLSGAAPERDEHGKVTEWRWCAKRELLLGKGAA